MRPRNILPLLLATTLASLSSCSKVNDMHDATMQMNATTSELANTTKETKKLMAEIYDSGRQGESLDLRSKLFDRIINSPRIEEKATNAGLYFLAFEFELWSNLGSDEQKGQRETLMRDAADEFFCRLLGITHWDEVDPFAGKNLLASASTENEKMAFNALSIALERNNRKQLAAAGNDRSVSMLNMIETALVAGQTIREGKGQLRDYPAYVDVILAHEALAIRLLQARYHMLGLVVLTQLTSIAKNNIEGFKYKIWGSRWNLDFQKLNPAEIQLASYRLGEANRAREVLSRLGVAEELNPSIRKIYANAEMKNYSTVSAKLDSKGGGSVRAEAVEIQRGFVENLNTYLGNERRE